MNGLCTHCGSKPVTFNEISAVPVPPPTASWHPISHGMLFSEVQHQITNRGWDIVETAHALNREGLQYFGLMRIGGIDDTEQGLVIGLRNSMDKSLSAGLVAGSQVFVCDNLAFSGEVRIGRKHTTNILDNLGELIAGALNRVRPFWDGIVERSEQYRNTYIKGRVNDFVIDCLDRGIISGSQIPKVLTTYRTSEKYGMWSEDNTIKQNLWRGFNSVTEVLGGKAHILADRTPALYDLCDEYVAA